MRGGSLCIGCGGDEALGEKLSVVSYLGYSVRGACSFFPGAWLLSPSASPHYKPLSIGRPPMHDNRPPVLRIRLGTLAIVTLFTLLLAITIRYGIYRQMALASIPLLPLAVAAPLSLIRWRKPHMPLVIVQWILLLVLPLGTYLGAYSLLGTQRGLGANVMILLFSLLILGLIWLPQVAAILVRFHAPLTADVTVTGQFSLRTFMVAVTLFSVMLAGIAIYLKSSYGLQFSERTTSFGAMRWYLDTPEDEKMKLAHKVEQLLSDHLARYLDAMGYEAARMPDNFKQQADDGLFPWLRDKWKWTYYTKEMPGGEQVYVLVGRFDGLLQLVDCGAWTTCWEDDYVEAVIKPATKTQLNEVDNFVRHLAGALQYYGTPSPLEGVEKRLSELTIPSPSAPPEE
jgi:hypothetical protein